MFPSNGSLNRRPLPSAGSIGPVPPPRRYYEALRLPAARFAALRFLRLAIPPVRPVCSQRPGRTTVGSGELVFRVPSRKLSVETAGSLRFPSHPRVPTPCSQTPVGPMHARPLRRLGAAPASMHNGGSRNKDGFGAQSHGIRTRCLRFAGRVAPPPRKTRFRLLAKLCRAGFVHPQGCDERFPSFESLSPFSSLPDASIACPMVVCRR